MNNFMKYRWLFALISAMVIVPGVISLAFFGLRPGLDFTGGSLWEVRMPRTSVSEAEFSATIQPDLPDSRVTQLAEDLFQVKGPSVDNQVKDKAWGSLYNTFNDGEEVRFETLGPAIGQELVMKTAVAIGLCLVIILGYLAWQFKELKYGVCAVLALAHDSLVLVGVFSLLGHFFQVEVDALFVTAFLTTLSFSVHDTIVVYDRIRELQKMYPKEKPLTIVNAALRQTLVRSLNNSVTVIIMLAALVILGGETVTWFAVALLIGAITGTYSSTFVAVPLLYTWGTIFKRKAVK